MSVEIETWMMRTIADLRADWLTPLMRALSAAGTDWTPTILGGATVILLLVFKRWRHLFVFLGALAVLGGVTFLLYLVVERPRPYEIEIIGPWNGFAMPLFSVAVLAACLVGIAYSLVVPGRPRQWAKWAIAVVVAVVAFARLSARGGPTAAVSSANAPSANPSRRSQRDRSSAVPPFGTGGPGSGSTPTGAARAPSRSR